MEKAFFMAEGLFDIQRVFRQDHPGVIGIQMVAGEESHPAEIDAHVAFADASARRARSASINARRTEPPPSIRRI